MDKTLSDFTDEKYNISTKLCFNDFNKNVGFF